MFTAILYDGYIPNSTRLLGEISWRLIKVSFIITRSALRISGIEADRQSLCADPFFRLQGHCQPRQYDTHAPIRAIERIRFAQDPT